MYKKSALLQKTEDDQVMSLVERKIAFSAGGLWMALGFRLMGSKATVRAQMEQIKSEKAAAAKTEAKKEKDIREKVEKASASFELFKTSSNMPAEAWRDIIKFLVPLYDNKSAPSKFNSVKKAKDKLATFDKEYGSSWDALMEVQLKNFQAKQNSEQNKTRDATADLEAQLHLEEDSVSCDIGCEGDDDEGCI